MLAELNARVRSYEENLSSIARQQEEKEAEYEEMYQKLIIKDEQLIAVEEQLSLFQDTDVSEAT